MFSEAMNGLEIKTCAFADSDDFISPADYEEFQAALHDPVLMVTTLFILQDLPRSLNIGRELRVCLV